MTTTWILLLAFGIFLSLIFLYYKISHRYVKKEYGKKAWKHWPSQLSYWQAAVLYSVAGTALVMYALKWTNILTF